MQAEAFSPGLAIFRGVERSSMDANGRPYYFFWPYNSPKSFTVALPFPAKSLFATISKMGVSRIGSSSNSVIKPIVARSGPPQESTKPKGTVRRQCLHP
jgi:hypothetical protein